MQQRIYTMYVWLAASLRVAVDLSDQSIDILADHRQLKQKGLNTD